MVDFLIVGGGIAGINVAWELFCKGKSFHLVDPFLYNSATSVAAGLINPVTGRKFAEQWNIDALLPLTEKTYAAIGHHIDAVVLFKKQIFKIHKNESVVEDWLKAQAAKNISGYINAHPDTTPYARFLDYRFGAIGIQPAYHVNTMLLQEKFYEKFQQHIIRSQLQYDALTIHHNYISFLQQDYRHIIFCEGIGAQKNPWFQQIAFKPAKGECLIIEVPNMMLQDIIIKGVIVVPAGTTTYWVGATNTWNDLSDATTQQAYDELNDGLHALLKLPYQIIRQKAAIRPTIKDRTPVVGTHAQYSNMHILNGLGTKGTSLAPYYAQQLIAHILYREPMNTEVRINRF